MVRTILVLVDGTPRSEWAVTEAAALALEQRAAHTARPVEPLPAFISLAALSGQCHQREYADLVERTLRRAAAALPRDLSVATVLREGRPARLPGDEAPAAATTSS